MFPLVTVRFLSKTAELVVTPAALLILMLIVFAPCEPVTSVRVCALDPLNSSKPLVVDCNTVPAVCEKFPATLNVPAPAAISNEPPLTFIFPPTIKIPAPPNVSNVPPLIFKLPLTLSVPLVSALNLPVPVA